MKKVFPWLWASGLLLGVTLAAAEPREIARDASLAWPQGTVDTWHGFVRHKFIVDGCQAWVAVPKQPLPGNPWSWCMEFPDAFTERCAAPTLLAKGFYHVHLAVGNTFGSPAALEHFDKFYAVLRSRGLAHKAVLIGLSRGGLYAYRWASKNPEKVAVIYGDAPVCDFKSWPGGKGRGKGSVDDWHGLWRCYGFADEAAAMAFPGNPVDTLAPLAKAGVALIHVVGDADEVVPADENTAIIEARYRHLGAQIRVIHKPGVGHHPHGLDDPAPVVQFIIDHAARTPATSDSPGPSSHRLSTSKASTWQLPDAGLVQLSGPLGEAYRKGVERLRQDPYRSAAFLRADVSGEMKRIFTNYSGDISGRFMEIASLTSPPGRMQPETLPQLIEGLGKYQKADGHFGAEVDWNGPLEPESPSAVKLPIFWGHSRLLVGLLEAHRAFDRPELLQIARRVGDFYIATADRFLDPAREAEYRATGTYAAGYPTDYFPGIEGLARLYQATRDKRYLRQAERMAAFFERFDMLPIDHSHGNLITHSGLLSLYEITGKRAYLERPMRRWQEAVDGGYVWPTGGVGERFHVASTTDEGCSEADWLRLNLSLWRLTGQTRFLDSAERLLENHYAMNRTANGGYGHHNFVCDADGPLLMQPAFTEAVWCCTFHGLLGLHMLRSYLVVGSQLGPVVNFPADVVATVATRRGRWKVTVAREDRPDAVVCRVQVDAAQSTTAVPELWIRQPVWAEGVEVIDRAGRACEVTVEGGYVRLPIRAGAEGELRVTFGFKPRVEDRRLQRLAVAGDTITRHRGVVLGEGPRVLLANSDKPRPIVVLRIDPQGRPLLPRDKDGHLWVATADRLDATEQEIAAALGSGPRLRLAPWDRTVHDLPAALVFDAITVPTSPEPPQSAEHPHPTSQ